MLMPRDITLLLHLCVLSFVSSVSSFEETTTVTNQLLNDQPYGGNSRLPLGKSGLFDESSSNNDIVVLRWPEAKHYSPPSDMYVPEASEVISTRLGLGSNSPSSSTDSQASEQSLVPESLPAPDDINYPTENSKIAPFPPHPDYVGNSANADKDDEDEEDQNDPEVKWKKMRKKLSLRPVDHSLFKTNGKHVATLPYAPTQPFTDLQYAINQVRMAVYKISPSRRLANDAFKKFNVAVKSRIKNMRGPYGYSYPPGYYDFRYEADDNPAPSEEQPVYVAPPPDIRVDNDTMIDDGTNLNNTLSEVSSNSSEIERRLGIPAPVLDEEEERIKNLEQRSFGFKVTVYRTPGNKESSEAGSAGSASNISLQKKDVGDLASVASYPKSYFSSHITRGPQNNLGYYNPAPQIERIQHHIEGAAEAKRSEEHQDTHSKTVDVAAYEHKKKQRLKEEASHDKRASAERALKERTVIEFFEREKIPSDSYHHSPHHEHHPSEGNDDTHQGHLPLSRSNYPSLSNSQESREKMPYYIEQGGKGDKTTISRLYYEPKTEETRQNSIKFQGASLAQQYGKGNKANGTNSPSKTQELLKKGTHVDYVYHPKQGGYGPSSSSVRDYFPSLDEKIDSNGWRETGYKIITEVEYVDKDAHQEKGFEARDKGKAEHVKDLIQKTNYKGEVKGSSYDTGISSYGSPGDNPHIPGPLYASTNRFPVQVLKDPKIMTNTRTQSRVPPHALEPHMSRDELIKRLNNQRVVNTSDNERLSMSDSSLSIQHTNPVISAAVIPPVSQVFTNGLKREDRYPSTDFVEIVANGSYPYAVYIPPDSTSTTSSTATTTEEPLTTSTTSSTTSTTSTTSTSTSTSTFAPANFGFNWITTTESSITEVPETTTEKTTSTISYQLRKPPKHVNALNVVESPVIIVNGSESQIVEQEAPTEYKFSKLVSIEEPPEMVQARLEREQRKKMKEAQEKLMAQQMASQMHHQYFHDKYHHQPATDNNNKQTSSGAGKFIQYFYQRNPFSSGKKSNSKYQTSSSEKSVVQISKIFGGSQKNAITHGNTLKPGASVPVGLRGSLGTTGISETSPYNIKIPPNTNVMNALQSSLGYGFPSPTSSNNPFNASPTPGYPTQNSLSSVNNILKTGSQAGKSVLNKLASYRPLQMMLPSVKNFKFLPPSPSSPSLSSSLFPLSHQKQQSHPNKLHKNSFQGISNYPHHLQGQHSFPLPLHTRLLDSHTRGRKENPKDSVTPDNILASWILQQTGKGVKSSHNSKTGNTIAVSSILSVLPTSGVKANLNNNDASNFLLSSAASQGGMIPAKRRSDQSQETSSLLSEVVTQKSMESEGNQRMRFFAQEASTGTVTNIFNKDDNNIFKQLVYDYNNDMKSHSNSETTTGISQESHKMMNESETPSRVSQSNQDSSSFVPSKMQMIPMTQPIVSTSTPYTSSSPSSQYIRLNNTPSSTSVRHKNYFESNLEYLVNGSPIKRNDENSVESIDEKQGNNFNQQRGSKEKKKASGSNKTLNDVTFQPEKDSLIPNLIQDTLSHSSSSFPSFSNQPPFDTDFLDEDEETTTKYSQPLVVKSSTPPVSLFEALLKSLWIADHRS